MARRMVQINVNDVSMAGRGEFRGEGDSAIGRECRGSLYQICRWVQVGSGSAVQFTCGLADREKYTPRPRDQARSRIANSLSRI